MDSDLLLLCLIAACARDKTMRRSTSILSGTSKRWHRCVNTMFHNQLAASTERLQSLSESLGPTNTIMQTLESIIKERARKHANPSTNLKPMIQEVRAFRMPPGGVVETLLAAACVMNPQLCEEEGLPVMAPVVAGGVPDSQKVWGQVTKINAFWKPFCDLPVVDVASIMIACTNERLSFMKSVLDVWTPDVMNSRSCLCGILAFIVQAVVSTAEKLSLTPAQAENFREFLELKNIRVPSLSRHIQIKSLEPALREQLLKGHVAEFLKTVDVDSPILQLLLSNKLVRDHHKQAIRKMLAAEAQRKIGCCGRCMCHRECQCTLECTGRTVDGNY